MDIKETLALTPETLARRQYDALVKHTCDRLNYVRALIEMGNFRAIEPLLFNSPAGDGHGCDNSCISFEDTGVRGENGCAADIGDVISRLEQLQKLFPVGEKEKR